MKITGEDVRPGAEFKVSTKPTSKADSTFAALTGDGLTVTRCLVDLWEFPDHTLVLAHWHGAYRTDGFATTVGELKVKVIEAGFKLD